MDSGAKQSPPKIVSIYMVYEINQERTEGRSTRFMTVEEAVKYIRALPPEWDAVYYKHNYPQWDWEKYVR